MRPAAYPTGVQQFVILALGWATGVVICGALARRVTLRLGLPWRDALMYFGVVPYPDELMLGDRRSAPGRPSRR